MKILRESSDALSLFCVPCSFSFPMLEMHRNYGLNSANQFLCIRNLCIFAQAHIAPRNMSKNHLYKGTLSSILLKLLSEEGRMYGYEISKRAKLLSQGDLDITEGALYPALHKLEANGLISAEIEMVGKRSRKYYKLTEAGGKEAKDRTAELKEYAKNLQLFLNPTWSNG